MPTPIPLQDSAVYGPIHSRRFGNSLGINILPLTRKVCSSNCVYCQYGWTPTSPTERSPERSEGRAKPVEGFRRAPDLLREIDEAFARHRRIGTPVDCVTIAGNGEPTLHPDLEALIVGIKRLRDRYFPTAPVGILSDATQLTRPRVRDALQLLDVRCLKFDAADEATWRRINVPLVRVGFDDMVDAIRAMPDIILQSLFLQGSYDNTDERHVAAWVAAVRTIRPRSVQVYTVDRPTAADGIRPVPREQLQVIADRLTAATGIHADVFE